MCVHVLYSLDLGEKVEALTPSDDDLLYSVETAVLELVTAIPSQFDVLILSHVVYSFVKQHMNCYSERRRSEGLKNTTRFQSVKIRNKVPE